MQQGIRGPAAPTGEHPLRQIFDMELLHGATPKVAYETVTPTYIPLYEHFFAKDATWRTHFQFIN